jgi:OmpA-OmpF porin, OOP family
MRPSGHLFSASLIPAAQFGDKCVQFCAAGIMGIIASVRCFRKKGAALKLTRTHPFSTLLSFALATTICVSAQAQTTKVDVAGGKDHPLIKRFAGSWLTGMRIDEFAGIEFPSNGKEEGRKLVEPVKLEAKVTRLYYVAPRGKTPLEVHRNYEQALAAAGFVEKYKCELDACAKVFFALPFNVTDAKWASGYIETPSGSGYSLYSGVSVEDGRLTYGTINKAGVLLHVMVYTSAAANKTTELASTYLQIAEPKAMQTGQVTVDTTAMKSGLDADGKIALYGIYFDTGKAALKPESKAQLDEMGKLLTAQANLKVIIVGHTDNQGTLEANVALSQSRAEAVAQALTQTYKIATNRMLAKGVANFSPIASNAAESGRAKNRRVELVAQ